MLRELEAELMDCNVHGFYTETDQFYADIITGCPWCYMNDFDEIESDEVYCAEEVEDDNDEF